MAVFLNGSVGDPNGDVLRITSGILNNNIAYTFMFWVKLEADTDRINTLVYFTNGGAPAEFLAIANDGVTLSYTSLLSGSSGYTTFGSALTPGQWYHITIVRPDHVNAPVIYVDGVPNFTGQVQNVSGRPAPTKLDMGGGNPDGSSPLFGSFGYARAWGTALTQAEIQAEIWATKAVKAEGLYADWWFTGSGTLHLDRSGFGHHWLARGSVTETIDPPFAQTISPSFLPTAALFFNPVILRQGAETLFPDFLGSAELFFDPTVGRFPLRLDLGVVAQDAQYEHRGIYATEVEISYYPKAAYTGKLWETKSEDPSKVKAGEGREILVSPETSEGFTIVPFTVNPFGVGGSTFTALDGDAVNRTALVSSSIKQEGQRLRVSWFNSSPEDVTITAEIHGTGYVTKDRQTLLVADADLLVENRFRHVPARVDFNLIADEIEAQNLAQHIIDLTAEQRDGIFEVRYRFGSSLSDLDRAKMILNLKVGDVIQITEKQSGLINVPHIILGESFSFGGGTFAVTHTLIPVKLLVV